MGVNAEQAAPPVPASRFAGFRHYALWWCLWLGGIGFISYGSLAERTAHGLEGVLLGLFCAALFALAQNTLNKRRRKPISWLLAILAFFIGKAFLVMVAML